MVDVLSLVSYLKTRCPHAKMHRIHVNHVLHWFPFRHLCACLSILESWYLYVDLFAPPVINGSSKTQKSWMWTSSLFWNE